MQDNMPEKKTVENWLKEVNYSPVTTYIPGTFALEFINFIKLVNGAEGEENLTPVLHYKMLDKIAGETANICNMLFRGSGKTTLLAEYLFLYLGVYGSIPGFGKAPLALYVSDSIDNGVKNMRKNLQYRWENSEFLQSYIPETRFTDTRWEFINRETRTFVVKGFGAKALSLDTQVITTVGSISIKDIEVGAIICSPKGTVEVVEKSLVFHRPMYCIELEDGRTLKVCEEHLNSVVVKMNPDKDSFFADMVLDTNQLLKMDLQRIKTKKSRTSREVRENLIFIRNPKPVIKTGCMKPFDPYLLGLILGAGSIKPNGSCVLSADIDDMKEYLFYLPDNIGEPYTDERDSNKINIAIKGLNKIMLKLKLADMVSSAKFIPNEYYQTVIGHRMQLLQGLMDSSGSIQKNGSMHFYNNSEKLIDNVASLVRSLGGTAKKEVNKRSSNIKIWISENPFKLPKKADKFTGKSVKNKVAITSITRIPDEPSQCIRVKNRGIAGPLWLEVSDEHEFLINDYIRTHNTGVRGTKEMGKRPVLAVLDDLVSDEDARSPTVIASIEDTVYKAIDYALHPNKRKTIWSGTPFNSRDPLYKAVESGAWDVNVYPVCEEFPCEFEDFRGAWEDRFTYKYVMDQYNKALRAGKLNTFNQELMLKIMSEKDRLITDADIVWYKRSLVLQNKAAFNFYITTDFAVSETSGNDFSVISVWAYNANGDWLWVDGICKRQLMDKNVDDLFRLAQMYKPQSVGVEISGQQKGFIPWIQDQMLVRNNYFTLASENNNNKPGIRPVTKKIMRFHVIVPMFKLGKIWFPEEMKDDSTMVECMDELSLVTREEFKSKHDDFCDTISQLSCLQVWKPSNIVPMKKSNDNRMWEDDFEEPDDPLASYII